MVVNTSLAATQLKPVKQPTAVWICSVQDENITIKRILNAAVQLERPVQKTLLKQSLNVDFIT